MDNYYEILEVSKNASSEVISKIYKYHIKNNHPDLFTGEERIKAEEKVQKLNEAYDILSNPEKRKEYDLSLQEIELENKKETENIQNSNIDELKRQNEYLKHKLSNCDRFIHDYFYERAPEVISIIENYDSDINFKKGISFKNTALRYLFIGITYLIMIIFFLYIISIAFDINIFKIIIDIFSQK